MRETLRFAEFARAVEVPPSPEESWRPTLLCLKPDEASRFEEFCRRRRIAVIDRIERQVEDLAAVRLPSSKQLADRECFVEETMAGCGGRASYGTWVYFPWDSKAVHLLDPDEYFEVITDRNRDKITREEQQTLRGKKVGVVGLSVGAEAAVTIAQEHLCGHLVLADFDRLDLSNLNRLNAGCDELGLSKAIMVARRVAKIDPYIEVTVYHEGVTGANARQFLDGLDLLIEECDGLQVKYDLRLLARERGVNVVYAADERGFLSIEPYAFWPELRPFHGLVETRPQQRETYATPHDFMKALAEWLGGWENISPRARHSLGRVGDTLSGYPQLAGEARYAAGQVGAAARRLLLGERLPPFVGNIDLAELIPSGDTAA